MKALLIALLCVIPLSGYSQDSKAYGNVNFGASKSQYYQEIDSNLKKIGDYNYRFVPEFYKDSLLTTLNIHTETVAGDKQQEAKSAISNLVELFTKRYGTPKYFFLSESDYDKLKPEKKSIYTYWELGKKKIFLGFVKHQDGSIYGYCSMWNPQITDEVMARLKTDVDAGKF